MTFFNRARPLSGVSVQAFHLALALCFVVTSSCAGTAELRAPAIGAPAPTLDVLDLEGAPVSLASLKGHVVVLNAWATWCSPCIEEIPLLEHVHRTYGSQGLTTVGVSIDAAGMGADVKDFMTEHNMSYRVWLDPDNSFAVKFLTVGVPETFVLDRAGVIRWRARGALQPSDTTFAAAIRTALAAK